MEAEFRSDKGAIEGRLLHLPLTARPSKSLISLRIPFPASGNSPSIHCAYPSITFVLCCRPSPFTTNPCPLFVPDVYQRKRLTCTPYPHSHTLKNSLPCHTRSSPAWKSNRFDFNSSIGRTAFSSALGLSPHPGPEAWFSPSRIRWYPSRAGSHHLSSENNCLAWIYTMTLP